MKVLCHGFALAGGRNQEVAAPAAPSGVLGHRHGSCPQRLRGPICVLVCDLTSFLCPNLSHRLPPALPVCLLAIGTRCQWLTCADPLCSPSPHQDRSYDAEQWGSENRDVRKMEMSEVAEVGGGFGRTVPALLCGAEPQRWVPSSDPALFLSA